MVNKQWVDFLPSGMEGVSTGKGLDVGAQDSVYANQGPEHRAGSTNNLIYTFVIEVFEWKAQAVVDTVSVPFASTPAPADGTFRYNLYWNAPTETIFAGFDTTRCPTALANVIDDTSPFPSDVFPDSKHCLFHQRAFAGVQQPNGKPRAFYIRRCRCTGKAKSTPNCTLSFWARNAGRPSKL